MLEARCIRCGFYYTEDVSLSSWFLVTCKDLDTAVKSSEIIKIKSVWMIMLSSRFKKQGRLLWAGLSFIRGEYSN